MGVITTQQEHTIKRLIARYGQDCRVTRASTNQYGEPTGDRVQVIECKGLWHWSPGHLDIALKDAGAVQDRKTPRVLIPYRSDIRVGDQIAVGGTVYRITGTTDIGNEHLFQDVSLGGDADD